MQVGKDLQTALEKAGLGAFYPRFVAEKIDIGTFQSLSDTELTRLGVETMGDRIRLRREVEQLRRPSTMASSVPRAPHGVTGHISKYFMLNLPSELTFFCYCPMNYCKVC